MIMMSNNLRVFVRVAELGSFTSAANELFISQPAVSRAVKAVENELRVKLFHRDKRSGLLLTDVGERVLALARQMADVENRIYQEAFRENNFLGGRVRVASMPILTSAILSKVLFAFREKHPSVTVELIEGSSMEIRKAVTEHRVDFGFASSPFGDLDSEVLLTDRMVAASRLPLAAGEAVDLYGEGERCILCRAGHETVIEELRHRKVALERSFVVQQAETVISLVQEGNGVGVISEMVLDATPNALHRGTVNPSVDIEIGAVANDLDDLTPVAEAFLMMVRDECARYRSERGRSRRSEEQLA